MAELPHIIRGRATSRSRVRPGATVAFYRDVSGSQSCTRLRRRVGPERHPDSSTLLRHRQRDRIAFFYYFGFEPPRGGSKGDVSPIRRDAPTSSSRRATSRSTSTARPTCSNTAGRLDNSRWPSSSSSSTRHRVDLHAHPNGYFFEITRALRPVTPPEDLDANLTSTHSSRSWVGPTQHAALLAAGRTKSSNARLAGSRRSDDAAVHARRPENTPIVAVADQDPAITVDRVGPYFRIASDTRSSSTAAQPAAARGLVQQCRGAHAVADTQWDKDAMRIEPA